MENSNNNQRGHDSRVVDTQVQSVGHQSQANQHESIDITKWSWGGFVSPWFVPLASKNFSYLLMFVLYFIPVLGVIFVHVFFGIRGRKILSQHDNAFASNTELAGYIRGYDRSGKYYLCLFLLLAAVFILTIFTSISE